MGDMVRLFAMQTSIADAGGRYLTRTGWQEYGRSMIPTVELAIGDSRLMVVVWWVNKPGM
jgi:hypothetical protein